MTDRISEDMKEDNNKQQADQSVKKFLDRLEQREDDQVAIISLSGRALSRSSNNNLHLATAGGIVAVPIANIKQVIQLNDSDPIAVRLVVSNPQDMKQLLGVKPAKPFSVDGLDTAEAANEGDTVVTDDADRQGYYKDYIGVGTCTYTDTDTITGGQGQPDACDDTVSNNCPPDDLRQ
jgi:hypothetical protein